jgi:hypothetical protein
MKVMTMPYQIIEKYNFGKTIAEHLLKFEGNQE